VKAGIGTAVVVIITAITFGVICLLDRRKGFTVVQPDYPKLITSGRPEVVIADPIAAEKPVKGDTYCQK